MYYCYNFCDRKQSKVEIQWAGFYICKLFTYLLYNESRVGKLWMVPKTAVAVVSESATAYCCAAVSPNWSTSISLDLWVFFPYHDLSICVVRLLAALFCFKNQSIYRGTVHYNSWGQKCKTGNAWFTALFFGPTVNQCCKPARSRKKSVTQRDGL